MWIDGFEGKKTIRYTDNDCQKIRIDKTLDMPEVNRKNNTIRIKGI